MPFCLQQHKYRNTADQFCKTFSAHHKDSQWGRGLPSLVLLRSPSTRELYYVTGLLLRDVIVMATMFSW